ncbi:pentatricopeptide repeat-containing protein At1g08070, chloroplastic-like [Dioscorea cayenensis subsp. rotundata]|uniref:Pentatricopeptide repeat-containing protein At1g08070, chloroplastic-like n=1 Tax=Dioscorea cayennensis subsp. rotundata TaxID=55577 RepID=A0AB40CMF4_DIOCR|nr:pentatricopeptide repeat-containing protein At1g08070, chloroplastic-like [Dioscorea cayenensis subsp. rotundata]
MLLPESKNLGHLKQAHAHILKHFPSFQCSSFHLLHPLLSSYACAHLRSALNLLALLPHPTPFLFNSLIRSLSVSNHPHHSVVLFRQMLHLGPRPNNFTYPFLVKSCTAALSFRCGVMVHTHVVRSGLEIDPYIQSALICMYAGCKDVDSARKVFDGCSDWQTVCWNSMLDGYVKLGEIGQARVLFDRMGCKDVISWNTMINGLAILGELDDAQELFSQMPDRNVVSWNSMLAGHVKCGDVQGACKVFKEMPQRDIVSWNTMLACYAQSGHSSQALKLFDRMKSVGMKPTDATIVSLLSACAHLGALDQGRRLHDYIDGNNIELSTILATALVDMYAKCGSFAQAWQIFHGIEQKDLLAWNTMMAGMAMHGYAEDALRLFCEMTENGTMPDDITFVVILSACSHAGMVKEGRCLLNSMKEKYGIDPKLEHYGCVIDLLARSGLLEEAMELTRAMPMEPNAPAWGALLGGCRIHENIKIAEDVGKRLLNIQPSHSGRYVLLSNIYATVNRWEDARNVRSMMIANGVAKIPGLSMIELKGAVHQFVAGDQSHPETQKIYSKLAEIFDRLKVEAGYLPDTKQVLLDIEEEEKENALFFHSEKLAIAIGLLYTSPDETIRVVKNLRVCRDCHHVMKIISKVYCREIIMRDRNRFHHFIRGACSCKGYW